MERKGFTLIEILAVIVILALIALITAPVVLNVIENSRDKSYRRSVDLYGKAIGQAVVSYQTDMVEKGQSSNVTFDNIEPYIEYEGNDVDCKIKQIYSDKTILLTECYVDEELVVAEKNKGYSEENYYYYTNFLRLSPFQKYISSNTVTILISGFGSENDIHSIEWRKYIENAPYDTNYYFYHWPGDTFAKIILKSLPIGITGIKFDSDLPKVFKESKDKAVICGKMLALILKSNLFFEHRQINLVAFSLGNHVVKNCLKELSSYNDNKCIINNITFIAGATTFKNKLNLYNRFKKVVAGRIINCYSKGDYILKFLYANCTGNKPIGNHEVIINDGNKGKNIFENYDFTDINLGHLSYRNNFNEVIKKINIEK